MDVLLSAAVIWFIIGFIFFILEFAIPGFILFFFGLGAWVVALLTLFTDPSINTQVLIFLGVSLLTALLFRNWVKERLGMKRAPEKDLPDEFVGKTARAETAIQPGRQGKVYFKGTSWNATSDDVIAEGDDVLITGYESITLIVKSISKS